MAGKVTPEFLKKLKEANNLLSIVGEVVVLRKSGANYTGLCPFHNERSPSFSVSERKQVYHCYGCKKGGDVVNFLQDLQGLSFMEAVELLAERGQVALPAGVSKGDPEAEDQRKTAFRLNRFASAYFHKNYLNSPELQRFFVSRGVDAETAAAFYVGYAPPGWDGLAQHLTQAKAPMPLAEKIGLIRPGQRGMIDHFRNRAIFPISDLRGRVVGFGGRALSSEDSPKYLNSSDSPLFQKSKVLFALFQAQKHIREEGSVIIVEGYFDTVALWRAGIKNVVATCGTALTVDHLKLLSRLAPKIILFFDPDNAGKQAELRAMELGLGLGLTLYGAKVSEAMDRDADELLYGNNGRDFDRSLALIRSAFAEAEVLLDREIQAQVAMIDASRAETKVQCVKEVARLLGHFSDSVGAKVRAGELAKQLGVPPALLLPSAGAAGPRPVAFKAPPIAPVPKPAPTAATSSKPAQTLSASDTKLFESFIKAARDPKRSAEIRQKFDENGLKALPPEVQPGDHWQLFAHPALNALLRAIVAGRISADDFLATGWEVLPPECSEDRQLKAYLTELTLRLEAPADEPPPAEEYDPELGPELERLLHQLVSKRWAQFSQQIKAKLASEKAKSDVSYQAELMQEYLDVQRKLKEFNFFHNPEI